MADLLYRWPETAAVGQRVPKEKFYEHGAVKPAVRDLFVSEVQRITWAYKLAESTINLPSSAQVPEIQVFVLYAKQDDVSDAVLSAIDKVVQFPLVFEVMRWTSGQAEVRMVTTHKLLGPGAPKLGEYLSTGWLPANTARQSLPPAITLPALYTALLQPLTPLDLRPGEELSEVTLRLDAVRRLEREIVTLERKLRTEPQFNRKVELRRMLKTKQHELDQQR
ncbi:DUF4391 domain-containing protein [Brevibacterium luteolum]|uniref:DUF4391 domain-containing protein n=1 Tax=Brevibacterium luteolum TaxID=199591 RepID=UPI00223C1B54|nr:DUF4391 domain-containing protein [Brevibacterium luteolum]MCT1656866.1 DUF4391 domain-containing protein [Brevibacterium luteolum]